MIINSWKFILGIILSMLGVLEAFYLSLWIKNTNSQSGFGIVALLGFGLTLVYKSVNTKTQISPTFRLIIVLFPILAAAASVYGFLNRVQ